MRCIWNNERKSDFLFRIQYSLLLWSRSLFRIKEWDPYICYAVLFIIRNLWRVSLRIKSYSSFRKDISSYLLSITYTFYIFSAFYILYFTFHIYSIIYCHIYIIINVLYLFSISIFYQYWYWECRRLCVSSR